MRRKMKAVVYQGRDKVFIEEVAVPGLAEGDALIRVGYAGICGTDMSIVSGRHPRAKPPLILGHEFSGTVVRIKGKGKIKEGDRVVVKPLLFCGKCYACKNGFKHVCQNLRLIGVDVDGGFAEYVRVPLETVYKIPDNISLELAALTEPLAVSYHVVRRSDFQIGDTVVIIGGGPIGMLIGLMVKPGGASKVVISEVSEYRLKLAEELGFITINAKKLDPVSEVLRLTSNVGADLVFEVAGVAESAMQMLEMVRIKGEVILVSMHTQPRQVNLLQAHLKEVVLKTSRVYTGLDYEKVIKLLSLGKINVQSLVSHKFNLDDSMKALELMRKADRCMKILLKP